jgi:hypothetical protein
MPPTLGGKIWIRVYILKNSINYGITVFLPRQRTHRIRRFGFSKEKPCQGGYLTGLVGGGNEGKEETSFLLLFIIKQMLCQLTKILGLVSQEHPKFGIIYINISILIIVHKGHGVDAIYPIINVFPGFGHLYRQKSDS